MWELVLKGCRPVPMSSYLKALGLFRILAEQVDAEVRGVWNDSDVFVLHTRCSREEVMEFFLRHYSPSPLFDPWNGGSGFFKKKDDRNGARTVPTSASRTLETVMSAGAERLAVAGRVLRMIRDILNVAGIEESLSGDGKKRLITILRNSLPDSALRWLDAVVMMAGDSTGYPALLGSGGNDGNLDFANNFYQRILELFDPGTGDPSPSSEIWLEGALFGKTVSGLVRKAAIGQFNPGMTGGLNATSGFKDDSVVNPWEYVLMMEGTLAFSAAASRRFEHGESEKYSYPFTVKPVRAGYGSASGAEDVRAEMWLPLWNAPASYGEISRLFEEGRATVGGRSARDGIDFAMAAASMGIDRGIGSFQRFGFILRNGRSYFATPLGRFEVHFDKKVDLLDEIAPWLDVLRRKAISKSASVRRASRRLEDRVMDLCATASISSLSRLFISLGAAERSLVKSGVWKSIRLAPLVLRSEKWLEYTYDGTPEYRLAASVASTWSRETDSVRFLVEPLKSTGAWLAFDDKAKCRVPWEGDLNDLLCGIHVRFLNETSKKSVRTCSVDGFVPALPVDVAWFLAGKINTRRMKELLQSLLLLDWRKIGGRVPWDRGSVNGDTAPPGAWILMKLVFMKKSPLGENVPCDAGILKLAMAGRLADAVVLAASRVRSCGFEPLLGVASGGSAVSRRMAAALLFPVSYRDAVWMMDRVVAKKTLETVGKE